MVLVVVFDAFLASLKGKLVKRLEQLEKKVPIFQFDLLPPFSFEPDSSYLSGHYPEETNSGTHFKYVPEKSPFDNMKRWGAVCDYMPYTLQRTIRVFLRYQLQYITKNVHRVSTARIPFKFLPYFDIVQKHFPTDQSFCFFPTVFDLLRITGKKWIYLGAPVSSTQSRKIWEALRQIDLDDISLIFVFVGDLDSIGHHYGPNSPEYVNAIDAMAVFLNHVFDHVQIRYNLTKTLIFGDHGMVDVNRLINVQAVLDQLHVRPCKDYVYFLDSTLARFWFYNERARQIVTEVMQGLEGGRIITDEDRVTYRIRYPHNDFGELIWWADGGSLIFPNFWQDIKPVKGMHGYRHDVKDNHAGCILIDPELDSPQYKRVKQPLEMVDIFATIVDMLGLNMPDKAYGTSIYRRII